MTLRHLNHKIRILHSSRYEEHVFGLALTRRVLVAAVNPERRQPSDTPRRRHPMRPKHEQPRQNMQGWCVLRTSPALLDPWGRRITPPRTAATRSYGGVHEASSPARGVVESFDPPRVFRHDLRREGAFPITRYVNTHLAHVGPYSFRRRSVPLIGPEFLGRITLRIAEMFPGRIQNPRDPSFVLESLTAWPAE